MDQQPNLNIQQEQPSFQPQKPLSKTWQIVAIVVAGILVIGGVSYGSYSLWQKSTGNVNQIACTMEAKLCTDGSSVGRTGSNCEFAQCPSVSPSPSATPDVTADWQTYKNEQYGFEVRYPGDWKIVNVDWVVGRKYVQLLSPLINNKYYFVLDIGARNKGDNIQISLQPDEDWEFLKGFMQLGDKIKIGNMDVLTTEIVEKGKVKSILYSNRLGAGRVEISGLEIQADSGVIEGPQHLSASDVESIDLKNLSELKLANQILSTFKFTK